MDLTAVFAKTPKGVIEIKTRSAALTPAMRRVLILADGKRSLADLVPFVQPHDVETLASALREQGMIAATGGGAADGTIDSKDEIEAPALTTLNADTTTAQRPAVLHLTLPAAERFAERPGAGPPTLRDTIEFTLPLARELSFAVAAGTRAAHAAETGDAAARATDAVISARHNATLMRSLSVDEAEHDEPPEFNQQASETTRAGSTRARRTSAAGVVNGSASSAASGLGAAPIRSNAPVVNDSAGAVSSHALLEESKRLAVRALFERLGPYGEEPAAKIQECTSLEALHEQVQQAVRRIALFRGEKAAQEYLLMLAQP